MVDILQVLEGTAYVGFILGAIFAVIELRSLAKDRKTEMLLRFNERWASKENEEAMIILRESRTTDPRAIEIECSKAALWMVVDYLDGIADLAQDRLLDKKFVLELVAWDLFWARLEPWIKDMRSTLRNPFIGGGIEWGASLTKTPSPD